MIFLVHFDFLLNFVSFSTTFGLFVTLCDNVYHHPYEIRTQCAWIEYRVSVSSSALSHKPMWQREKEIQGDEKNEKNQRVSSERKQKNLSPKKNLFTHRCCSKWIDNSMMGGGEHNKCHQSVIQQLHQQARYKIKTDKSLDFVYKNRLIKKWIKVSRSFRGCELVVTPSWLYAFISCSFCVAFWPFFLSSSTRQPSIQNLAAQQVNTSQNFKIANIHFNKSLYPQQFSNY